MVLAISATLPTFTATALQNVQFLGYVCAVGLQLYDSLGNVGKTQLNDSVGAPFGESANVGTMLTVAATATGTNNSGVMSSEGSKKGANWMINIVSIAATCTVRMNLQFQDPNNSNFITLFTLSLDGSSLGTGSPIGEFMVQLYPGAVLPGSGAGTNLFVCGINPGNTVRAQVSVTATASGGGANINYAVNAYVLN